MTGDLIQGTTFQLNFDFKDESDELKNGRHIKTVGYRSDVMEEKRQPGMLYSDIVVVLELREPYNF